jgi:hypothetical protein
VVSDEIWSDLLLDDHLRHVPFASLDHPAARRAITLVAPSKTWNLAGLECAAAIVPDPALRRGWRAGGGGLVPMVNPLGYAAAEAAWRHGDDWRRRLVGILRQHRHAAAQGVEVANFHAENAGRTAAGSEDGGEDGELVLDGGEVHGNAWCLRQTGRSSGAGVLSVVGSAAALGCHARTEVPRAGWCSGGGWGRVHGRKGAHRF